MPGPVSEVYKPSNPSHHLKDEPLNPHYEAWGYSIGYVLDDKNNQVPMGCNTAVFRIAPGGMTEPVIVTKEPADSAFNVRVISGQGRLIRTSQDEHGQPKAIEEAMLPGNVFVITPGQAYAYQNIDPNQDLILHDVAKPAFGPGDDFELAGLKKNIDPDDNIYPVLRHEEYEITTPESLTRVITLPDKFFDLIGEAAAGRTTTPNWH